jgi:hypothetical protein
MRQIDVSARSHQSFNIAKERETGQFRPMPYSV